MKRSVGPLAVRISGIYPANSSYLDSDLTSETYYPDTHRQRADLSKRKLVVLSFVTRDGIMQAPGGPEEDTTGGFKHGGWSVGYWDDLLGNVMGEQMSKPFDLLLGRRTY